MGSPVVSSDFDITNFSGDVCTQLSQLLAQHERMKEWFAWAFDSSGKATTAFKNEFADISPPVGSVIWMPVNSVPTGWLLANGQAVSRTTYAGLFSVYGTTFGSGDGATTFNLPNLQGKFLLGASGLYSVTSEGGEAEHTLTVAEMPAHTHLVDPNPNANSPSGSGKMTTGGDAPEGTLPIITTSSTGGSAAHQNLPPYKAGLMLIKH